MSKSDGFRRESVHDESLTTHKSTLGAGDVAKYHLQLKQELELEPEGRRKVPATNSELLVFLVIFFRVSSFKDLQIMDYNYDLYMWVWIVLTIGKVLPSTYAHILFGKYSPQNHYSLPKITPILHGSKFIIPIVSTAILQRMIISQTFFLDTTEKLVFNRSPWNRCRENVSIIENVAVRCYEIPQYLTILHDGEKKKITTHNNYFTLSSETRNETFTLPHFLYSYHLKRNESLWRRQNLLNCLITLFLIGLTKNQIFKSFIWKHGFQWIYLFSSLTCPPVIHFLTARSNNRILPNSASTVIAIFSALNVFSRVRYLHQINIYILKTLYIDAYHQSIYGSGTNFLSIQIYHSSFYFGELLYLVYFTSKFLDLIISLIIGIQILFETITCEWKWVKWWWLFAVWCTLTLVLTLDSTDLSYHVLRAYQLIIWAALKDVLEMFAVIFFYPFSRLSDDFLFTFGFASTLFRKISYIVGFFFYSAALIVTMYTLSLSKDAAHYYFFAVIMILGAVYITFKTVCVDKKSWQRLFLPSPDWGPYDTKLRSQRKQFIGSDFIQSQAPRDLSRTMIKRRNQQVYNLDIDYVGGSPTSALSYAYEKKTK